MARRAAGLAPGQFPVACPFTIEDVLSDDWLPDAAG